MRRRDFLKGLAALLPVGAVAVTATGAVESEPESAWRQEPTLEPNQYLTDTNSWFLLTDREKYEVRWSDNIGDWKVIAGYNDDA